MLFEDDRSANRRLETMNFLPLDQLTERSQRAAVDLPVVPQRTKITLHFGGCVEPLNELPLARAEVFFAGDHLAIRRLCSLRRQKP